MKASTLTAMLKAMGIRHVSGRQVEIVDLTAQSVGFVPTKVCDFCGEPADLTNTDCGGKEHHICNSCLKAVFNGIQ